ncbi:MAG: hypothetical protein PHY29_02720 [Syntrophales bacterium]|nr:hypothetical protein [Syntrophales bacterium]
MMDTTPEYIKMSEKAWEIQVAWEPTYGDCIILKPQSVKYLNEIDVPTGKPVFLGICAYILDKDSRYCGDTDILLYDGYDESEGILKGNCIWLPSQDRLQEIVLPYIEQRVEKSCAGWRLAKEFVETMGSLVWGREWMNIKIDPGSMEQLWLAFVMKEKYGKTWNGEEWVKA